MKSKNILIYYQSLRSYILFRDILIREPELFDTVIKMPAIPYSRKTAKRNFLKYIRSAIQSPQYFLIQFLTIYVYSIFSKLFNNSIESICRKNKINHFYHERFDTKLVKLITMIRPTFIVNNSSSLLPLEMLGIATNGVINFHEAPLPAYRGSAAYFWILVNGDSVSYSTCHFVEEELDSGDIICIGDTVNVMESQSVFDFWRKMLFSHKKNWNYLIPFLSNNVKPESYKQDTYGINNYSYPSKEAINIIRNKKINFINFSDLYFIFKAAVNGTLE